MCLAPDARLARARAADVGKVSERGALPRVDVRLAPRLAGQGSPSARPVVQARAAARARSCVDARKRLRVLACAR
eukprot:2325846-Alexandrium_andersonii.AAC.1